MPVNTEKIVMCRLASRLISHYRANHRFCSQNEVVRPQGAFAGRATIICALVLILRAAYLRGKLNIDKLWFCKAKWSRKTTNSLCASPLFFRISALLYARRTFKKFLVPGVPRSDIYELWGFTGLFSKRTKILI